MSGFAVLASSRSVWLAAVLALCAASSACKKKVADQAVAATEQAAQPKEEPPVELKAKWPVGKRFVTRSDSSVETETTLPNATQPTKASINQSQEVAISVLKEREGGGRELEVEFLTQRAEQKSGAFTIVFDSKSDPKSDRTNTAAVAFTPLRKLIGLKLKFFTDAAGKVEKVEGVDELRKKALVGVPLVQQAIVAQVFSEDNLKKMAVPPVGLPDKPVKSGETWPLQTLMPVPPLGALQMDATYTFKGMEDHAGRKCALLDQSGTITNRPPAGPANTAAALTIEGGKISGQTWFDPNLGLPAESIADLSLTAKRTLPQGAFIVSIKQKTTTKLTSVSDIGSAAESKPAEPKADTAKSDAKSGDPKTPAATTPPKQ